MFTCITGCADCCGVVPLKKTIVKKYEHLQQVEVLEVLPFGDDRIVPITKDMFCVFLDRTTKRCLIYDDRPKVCRDFGVTKEPRLQCPHLKPSGNARSEASKKQLHRRMKVFQRDSLVSIKRSGGDMYECI